MEHTTRRTGKSKKQEPFGFLSILKGSAVGMGCSLLVGIPLIFLASLICARLPDPLSYVEGIGTGLFLFLSLLGGFLAARRNGGAPLPSGACVALLWFLCSVLLGIFLGDDSQGAPTAMILWRLMGIGLSVVGGFLGIGHAPAKRKGKHGRRR